MSHEELDGIFFASAGLFAGVTGHPLLCGLFAGMASLCKQSFALVPLGLMLMVWVLHGRAKGLLTLLMFFGILGIFCGFLIRYDALDAFKRMTSGPLDIREALDAGIIAYFRQNLWMPILAALPWCLLRYFRKNPQDWLHPSYLYLGIFTVWYVVTVWQQKHWIGFGDSWPWLFLVMGGVAVIFPKAFLLDHMVEKSVWKARMVLGNALLIAWSVAISGGYKVPAFFAAPLMSSFLLWSLYFHVNIRSLTVTLLVSGCLAFGIGYHYPYVFPIRHLEASALTYDAGDIYSKASHVYIDKMMYEKLQELKSLRKRYGKNYTVLPGFCQAYYLNDDVPVYRSDWLIDWEINAETETLYQELLRKHLTVFMEKDQMSTVYVDKYTRSRYTVPQRVRKAWKVHEETKHFVVLRAPSDDKIRGE